MVNVTEWTTASIALTGKKGGGQTGGHSRIREIIGKLKVGRWRIGAGEKVDAGVVKARSSMAVIIIGSSNNRAGMENQSQSSVGSGG